MQKVKNTIKLVGLVMVSILMTTYVLAEEASFQKLTIYQDKPSKNHYYISGYMPDGECVAMDDAWQQNCQEGRSCIKANFGRECAVSHQAWAGVYWLQPANNWGDNQGGLNLKGAKRLVFWARGEKGGETIIFSMGGVGMGRKYADTTSAATEPMKLTKDWQEYSIDLKDKDLTRITGGFAWVAHVKNNPSNATFYLDNMYYE